MASRNRVNGAAAEVKQIGRPPKLGQNFLTDRGTAEKVVAALGDMSRETVVEIGPGKGALTSLLAAGAGKLIAIELDRVLAAQLRMKYAPRAKVEIIEGDILKIDLSTVLGPRPGALAGLAPAPPRKVQVIGNIPYYITSDILLRLFSYCAHFDKIVIMVQKEVADRIAAKPGGKEYGLLSATAQLYANVEKLFTVPPEAFAPPPKVDSAVLRLTVAPQFERLNVPEREFIDFLKLGFGQKRKTLVNNLKPGYGAEPVKAALKKAGMRADSRSETLPLEKAAAVFRMLQGKEVS
ncbi:MAG: 16S rRNA (adenine(1518)-N(6)/adenine(1519)-N(6))-dimethyltransferase RsmA [Acidobacteriia bacterium]|nr:16S rRNA (adenine(1518)-N(6)/adenine(1519)-N(6))-dimethyltransferase RsmA [Terriglobia bacterium]